MGYNIYNTCASCHSINQRFVRVCIQDHLQILKKQMKEFVVSSPYNNNFFNKNINYIFNFAEIQPIFVPVDVRKLCNETKNFYKM